MPRGRSGRPWRRIKAEVLARRTPFCCRCGQPVDYSLPDIGIDGKPNMDAVTVEHLFPVSTHPELAEDLASLSVSHRRCNISAGNQRGVFSGQPTEQW